MNFKLFFNDGEIINFQKDDEITGKEYLLDLMNSKDNNYPLSIPNENGTVTKQMKDIKTIEINFD